MHVVRQCKTWLTQHPKSLAAFELLQIVKKLSTIKSLEESGYWLLELYKWNEVHHSFINEKTYDSNQTRFWYKHKMLRKARHLLIKAIPNLFHYLDDPTIPKTSNRLESFFGHLKDKLRVHRGLSYSHKRNFIKWYLFFKNEQGKEFY